MNAVTANPPTARTRGMVASRLRRELLHALLLTAGALILLEGAGVAQAMLPFHIWWPVLTGSTVAVALACGTPDGKTTVTHAAKEACSHPVHALALAAVVCAPWLAGWVQGAITAGAREAFAAALGAAPNPSLPGTAGVMSWVHGHIGGNR